MKSICYTTAIEDGDNRSLSEALIDEESTKDEDNAKMSSGTMLKTGSEYNSDDNFVPVDEPLYSDPCWWAALKKDDDNDLSWLASSTSAMLDASSSLPPPPSNVPISTLLQDDNAFVDHKIPIGSTIEESILNA